MVRLEFRLLLEEIAEHHRHVVNVSRTLVDTVQCSRKLILESRELIARVENVLRGL